MAMCESGTLTFTEGNDTSDKSEVESNTWYLDNGASNHMTGRREKFEKLDKAVKWEVKFGDGSLVRIEGKGSIRLACKNGETRVLQGVYYITALRSNIISLGQLTEEGNRVIIGVENLWIYDSCGRLLMQVKRSDNRLYKIYIEKSQQKCLLTKGEETAWLWHQRLGHLNFKAIHLMSKHCMAHGLPAFDQPKEMQWLPHVKTNT